MIEDIDKIIVDLAGINNKASKAVARELKWLDHETETTKKEAIESSRNRGLKTWTPEWASADQERVKKVINLNENDRFGETKIRFMTIEDRQAVPKNTQNLLFDECNPNRARSMSCGSEEQHAGQAFDGYDIRCIEQCESVSELQTTIRSLSRETNPPRHLITAARRRLETIQHHARTDNPWSRSYDSIPTNEHEMFLQLHSHKSKQ